MLLFLKYMVLMKNMEDDPRPLRGRGVDVCPNGTSAHAMNLSFCLTRVVPTDLFEESSSTD